MPRALPAHILHYVLDRRGVPLLVELEAQTATLVDNGGAQGGALLADAAREDEGVDAAVQLDVVAADEAEDAVDDDGEGELALRGGGAGDVPEVGGAGEGFPAGFLVEDIFGLRGEGLLGGWLGVGVRKGDTCGADVEFFGAAGAGLAGVVGEVED